MQLPRLSLRQKTIAMSAAVFRLLGERFLQRAPTSGALRIAAGSARSLHVGEPRRVADKSYKFVVCGAGPGGLAVASSLGRRFGEKSLAIIEPADVSRAVYEPVVRYAMFRFRWCCAPSQLASNSCCMLIVQPCIVWPQLCSTLR